MHEIEMADEECVCESHGVNFNIALVLLLATPHVLSCYRIFVLSEDHAQ